MTRTGFNIIALLIIVGIQQILPLTGYSQSSYTINDLMGDKGFSNMLIKTIYLDSDNLIWLGTANSVDRFDGNTYIRYSFPHTPVYKNDNIITSIVSTKDHDYWAGNQYGVWKLNHKTFLLEPAWRKDIKFPVKKLAADNHGNLYIGTLNGLYIANPSRQLKHLQLNKDGNTKDDPLVDIDVQSPEKVWWLVADGVIFCNPKTGVIHKYVCTDINKYGAFTCCKRIGNKLYLGTEKAGLVAFDLRTSTYTPIVNAWSSALNCLAYDTQTSTLGIGTMNDGISLYSLKAKKVVYSARYAAGSHNGLNSNSISSLLLFNKNIWVGNSFYLGWNYLAWHTPMFKIYKNGDFSTQEVPVRSFLHTEDYTFTGTREGFYATDEHTKKTSFYAMGMKGTDALRSNMIFSIYKYNNNYYIGTRHAGLYTFDPRSGVIQAPPEFQQLQNSDIFMFLTDEEGLMWIATLDGLFRYNPNTKQLKGYTPSNSNLAGDIVYSIMIDSHHRFWVTTNNGVAIFDRRTEKFTVHPHIQKLIGNRIVEMTYEDRKSGALFFVSQTGELFTVDHSLKQGRQLLKEMDVVVENIISDDRGNFWIGTNRGLLKTDHQFKQTVGYSTCNEIPFFIATSGTPMTKDKKGRLWMANVKGLVIIDPHVRYTPSALRITDIIVNGNVEQSINSTGIHPLSLGKSNNSVTFRFSSTDCGSLSSAWMEYMLEGYDASWKMVRGSGEAAYHDLPSGKYIFKVRRLLDTSSMAQVEVHITNYAAWIGALVAITILVAGAWTYRHRRVLLARLISSNEATEKDSIDDISADDETEFKAMADKIKLYMETNKPYLNVDFKQADLANATGYSIFLLSRMFNLYLKTGYYDFINTYRIEEFKHLVAEETYKTYTLETLAEKCGFKSQASFFRTFKKNTGMTPKNYINSQD